MTDIKNAAKVLQVRVKDGSALARLVAESSHKTVSGALHEIAAQHEAMREQHEQFKILIEEGRRREA